MCFVCLFLLVVHVSKIKQDLGFFVQFISVSMVFLVGLHVEADRKHLCPSLLQAASTFGVRIQEFHLELTVTYCCLSPAC